MCASEKTIHPANSLYYVQPNVVQVKENIKYDKRFSPTKKGEVEARNEFSQETLFLTLTLIRPGFENPYSDRKDSPMDGVSFIKILWWFIKVWT